MTARTTPRPGHRPTTPTRTAARAAAARVATNQSVPGPRAPDRVILGITGASGVVYGVRLLDALNELGCETHLIVTKAGVMTLGYETTETMRDLAARAAYNYAIDDIAAPVASGTFHTRGMIVAPCSVHSLSQIATGVTGNALTRAADVCLKERRRLVLMLRETPLHLGHLRNMAALTEMGAIIAPPMPAFYTKPQTIDDLIDHSVGRALDLLGLDWPGMPRWGENIPKSRRARRGR
jgi:4-hydroxy-3-polyprenylbenzoate decarboxylase